MAVLAFQKPEKVIMVEADASKGVFEFRPLEPGFGVTIGNALRRILLSSLEGFAITYIRVDGVAHEFSTIKGVVEDVSEIILNLKKVRFKRQIDNESSEKVTVVIGDQDTFRAGDINKYLSVFQVLNPEVEICHLDPGTKLTMEINVEKGRGYIPSEENRVANTDINTIFIDSIHTPIRNVRYQIDNYRVEQKTDYEKLTLEIETDGSILPKEALKEAAKILIHHFMLFSDEKITLDAEEKAVDMDLSVRALNCLKAADVETLGDLVQFNKNDLLKFRNFGKKSLTELEDLVKTKGLEFGMNVAKYKLDKE
jgi:DNA-directed RNA polymerase subunit alpha